MSRRAFQVMTLLQIGSVGAGFGSSRRSPGSVRTVVPVSVTRWRPHVHGFSRIEKGAVVNPRSIPATRGMDASLNAGGELLPGMVCRDGFGWRKAAER